MVPPARQESPPPCGLPGGGVTPCTKNNTARRAAGGASGSARARVERRVAITVLSAPERAGAGAAARGGGALERQRGHRALSRRGPWCRHTAAPFPNLPLRPHARNASQRRDLLPRGTPWRAQDVATRGVRTPVRGRTTSFATFLLYTFVQLYVFPRVEGRCRGEAVEGWRLMKALLVSAITGATSLL